MENEKKYVFRADGTEEKPAGKYVFRTGQSGPVQTEKPRRSVYSRAAGEAPVSAVSTARRRAKRRPVVRRSKQYPLALPLLAVFLLLALVICLVILAVGLLADRVTSDRLPADEWPVCIGDAVLEEPPQRIVSLSPMVTQALLSLPGQERLMGVTEYCPGGSRDLPIVGTPLLPRIETIRQLEPDCVIYQTPLTGEMEQALEATGATLVQLTMPHSLAELKAFYSRMGALMLGEKTGSALGIAAADRLDDNLIRCAWITGGSNTALFLPDLSGLASTVDTPEWAVLGQVFRHPLPEKTNWLADEETLKDEDSNNDMVSIIEADPDLIFVPEEVTPEQVQEKLGSLRAVENGCVVYYNRLSAETLSPTFIFDIVRGVQLLYPS